MYEQDPQHCRVDDDGPEADRGRRPAPRGDDGPGEGGEGQADPGRRDAVAEAVPGDGPADPNLPGVTGDAVAGPRGPKRAAVIQLARNGDVVNALPIAKDLADRG